MHTDKPATPRSNRRFGLVRLTPRQALMALVPAALACAAVAAGGGFLPPGILLVLAAAGIIPAVLVVAWGTLKFRSYYEVKRSKADLLTMVYATLIQLLALAPAAYLYVTMLSSYDVLVGQTP
ncbi:hypothetical protein [Arthrobacter flavus]|uniref:Uncharacterized protein n=1 Tax=Arthrobacter flavus TaxID=95172 RepID=A0ABW4QC26_9MICC